MPSQRSAPVGLDFGEFVQKPASGGGRDGCGGGAAGEIGGMGGSEGLRLSVEGAAELERSSAIFSSILSERLAELRAVRALWQRGNVVGALLHVAQLQNPLHVAADLLGAVSLQNQGLNIEGCSIVLPLVSQLVASQFDE